MDVLVLIDKLDDLVHNAKGVPMTDQVRVDKEEIYDILDQMRATIPEEIKQARWIVKERQEMLQPSARRSGSSRRRATASRSSVSEQEVTKQAERAAEDIIEDARAREREIRLGAEDYADEILNTLEVNLSKFIAAVERGSRAAPGEGRAGGSRIRRGSSTAPVWVPAAPPDGRECHNAPGLGRLRRVDERPMLELVGLRRSFGRTLALDDLSFSQWCARRRRRRPGRRRARAGLVRGRLRLLRRRLSRAPPRSCRARRTCSPCSRRSR